MPIKPRPAPKGTLIGLLRSWKPYEGDFEVKDIGPYRPALCLFHRPWASSIRDKSAPELRHVACGCTTMVATTAEEMFRMEKEIEGD